MSSVGVALIKSNGVVVSTITKKCGVYSFGRQPAGDYKFRVWSINGNSAKNRSTFLNATVTVRY